MLPPDRARPAHMWQRSLAPVHALTAEQAREQMWVCARPDGASARTHAMDVHMSSSAHGSPFSHRHSSKLRKYCLEPAICFLSEQMSLHLVHPGYPDSLGESSPTQPLPSCPPTHPDPIPPPWGGVGTFGQIAQNQTNPPTHRPRTPPPPSPVGPPLSKGLGGAAKPVFLFSCPGVGSQGPLYRNSSPQALRVPCIRAHRSTPDTRTQQRPEHWCAASRTSAAMSGERTAFWP